MSHSQDLLDFWFQQPLSAAMGTQKFWFLKDAAFDDRFRTKFADYYQQIKEIDLADLAQTPETALAECIILDQYPRNSFRDHSLAFATDSKALICAEKAIQQGFDQELPIIACSFLYLPFEHAEDADLQNRSVDLFTKLLKRAETSHSDHPELIETCKSYVDYAEKHRDIITRFQRFPHRNQAIGRHSTGEEKEFLTQPGSSF